MFQEGELSLKTLDRLSPSMMTLQSLMNEWPQNTLDSGYIPSPGSGDVQFTYSCEELGQLTTHEQNTGVFQEENFRSAENNELFTSKPKEDGDITITTGTPNFAKLICENKTSPPINIPSKMQLAVQVSHDYELENDDSSDNESDIDFESDTSLQEDDDQVEDFRRPRAYSCPESVRPVWSRPSVPLFATLPDDGNAADDGPTKSNSSQPNSKSNGEENMAVVHSR